MIDFHKSTEKKSYQKRQIKINESKKKNTLDFSLSIFFPEEVFVSNFLEFDIGLWKTALLFSLRRLLSWANSRGDNGIFEACDSMKK